MNSSKSFFAVGFTALCFFTYSYAIKCYSCESQSSCNSPRKVECNYQLANDTRSYLNIHHTEVNPNTTSPDMECLRENIKSNYGEYFYKGCIYTNIKACQLPLREIHSPNSTHHECDMCNFGDFCNPAGRTSFNIFVLVDTIIMGVIARYIWN
uniref:Protein sleepless n=1 Tax=Stomoxys calcitrans TaxID=35570 RepID=A0A1I8Q031_STOCA